MRRYLILFAFFLSSPLLAQKSMKDFETFEVVDAQGLEDEFSSPGLPTRGLGPVYNIVLNDLQDEYQNIGERQAQRILDQRDGLYAGGLNNIGYTFKRGFAYFDINVERQVAPDLFDDHRYIVTDKFEVVVDASKLFSNLETKGLVSLSEAQKAAFAGVLFKRTYRYTHFAENYQDALSIDLQKLFMAFTYTRNQAYLELEDYEILQREDYLSFNAGAVVVAPLGNGLGVSAGAMAKFESISKLEMQALGPEDESFEGESLRLSYEKTKGKSFGASAALQIEFLNFLRLTLFSYEFTYEYEESQKTYLSLSEGDVVELINNPGVKSQEIDKMVKGQDFSARELASYEVAHERRVKERKSSRYMALLYGGLRDQETEHIQISKDDIWTTFYRHNYESVSYKQSFWSRLIQSLFRSFLEVDSLVKHRYSDTKKLSVEYKSEENLLQTRRNLALDKLDKTQELSLNFNRVLQAQDLKRKKTKNKMLRLLGHFSGADPLAYQMLKQGGLKAPITLESKFTIKEAGVSHFNDLGAKKIAHEIKDVCAIHSRTFWQKLRNLFGGCRHKMNKSFDYYWREYAFEGHTGKLYQTCKRRNWWRSPQRHKQFYIEKCIQKNTYKTPEKRNSLPLWRLSDFSQTLHRYSENKLDMIGLFGLENVFLHGTFEAQSNSGPFKTYFNEGAFSGLGVVDQHMRDENLRSPASVNLEE